MKINFTAFGVRLTGGTFNIVEPAHRLAERGHDVTITTIGDPKDLLWFTDKRTPRFRAIFTPLSGKFAYRLYRRALKSTILHPFPEMEIRDLVRSMPDCDVNIATADKTTFAVHRSGKGKGAYYFQHYDSLFGKDAAANRLHDESYYLPLQKLTVSSWLKKMVESRLHVPVAKVITAGIDETVFFPREREAGQGKKKRILSLGRNIDWKGFAELREAMRRLFAKRNDIEWFIYSSHDTPEPTADAPFTIVHSPYGKALADLYASADIVVNPSWHEGFAQPALEAMACGAAVITTPIGAEDFTKPGENCLVVEPKNPAQIEAAIERLLDDDHLRAKMINGGVQTSKQFYWDRIIDRWEEMLKEIHKL
jgi:glycosyltransferase involved in cell wall biosynthesis